VRECAARVPAPRAYPRACASERHGEMTHDELVQTATLARERALAANSGFKVGAALLAASGRVYQGCNIENHTLNLGLCAERVALMNALSAGERTFESLAIVADWDEPITPCGACRQLLWEFAGDLAVISQTVGGRRRVLALSDLLPLPFKIRLDSGGAKGDGEK